MEKTNAAVVPIFVPPIFVPLCHRFAFFRYFGMGTLLVTAYLLSGCTNIGRWQEEVKLSDGRLIIVTQKRRYEEVYTGHGFGNISRETWVIFRLPEFSDQEIVWQENLNPQVLNTHEGKLYLVSQPGTLREFRQYGSPKPSYVGYRYDKGQWVRIPFNEIPVAIYDSNMWFDTIPPKESKFISLDDKKKQIESGRYSSNLKKIDPTYIAINY